MSIREWRTRLGLLCALVVTVPTTATAAAQGHVAAINGERLYYEVAGEGPTLVLIHGWTLNQRMWDPQVPTLSRRFRVIRYDRRGFGKSSGVEDISWDAADLRALLDTLGATRVHLLGMSQGGRVALQFVRDNPDRVVSLILHGSPAPDGFGLPQTGADRMRLDEWAAVVREQGLDAFRRAWAAHPLMEVPAGRPEARARVSELLAAYRGGRFLSPRPPTGPIAQIAMTDLPRIGVPTLVVVGESEVPFLQIVGRALAYYLPKARFAVVPGGGHMVNLIEPDRYNAVVLGFLDGVSTDSRK